MTQFLAEPITVNNPVVRQNTLLDLLIEEIDIASGGPGVNGATFERASDSTGIWSSLQGLFLGDQNDNQLMDQDGNYLIG